MKVIIPMAGEGSRFKNIGLSAPKYQLKAFDKTLFDWSLLSLSDFFENEFLFICRTQHFSEPFITESCERLGIKRFQLLEIDENTDGQASTGFHCDPYIDPEDSVVIYNIDTYVEEKQMLKRQILDHVDGFIPVFDVEGDKWSFVRFDETKPNVITEITEKIRISNWGTVGFYYFKKWRDFKRIYQQYKEEIKVNYKESYIAPMYHYLIQEGKEIHASIIDKDTVHILGTPEDLIEFCPDYLSMNS
ncbi:MAG: hypothetical protein ACO1N0_13030 [Fluviicola sp.]